MSADEKLKLLTSELAYLIPLLQSYPKCYWIWNYRIFLLQTCSEQLDVTTALIVWKGEMKLVDKMLGRDARNFHGWGYRRGVVGEIERLQGRISGEGGKGNVDASAGSLVEEEFQYTTAMYQKNLSNFSAWHNRSKLIPRLLDERNANPEERRTFLDGELGIMQEALFTDPYDQSLQLYHHWLISATCSPASSAGAKSGEIVRLTQSQQLEILSRTLAWMRELLEEEPECRLLLEELIFVSGLVRGHVAENNDPDTISADEVKSDMQSWLDKLMVVDPMRIGRWQELAERL
ncbi:Rab geranylgeranyltransferase, variant 2 [Orbilia brochopaga]